MSSVEIGGMSIFYEVMGGSIIDSPITIPMMADDVAGVLDALAIRKANVFGVSMGGVISQRFALNHRDRVSNLVLGCTTPGGRQHVPAPPDGVRLLFDFEYLKSMTPEQRTMAVFHFMVSEEFIKRHPEVYQSYHRATVDHAIPTRTFRYQAEAIAGEDTWDGLGTLTSPTLLITGSEDRIVPCGNSQKMAKCIPGAELVMLKGMRHGFYIEAVEETIDAIVGFIKKNTSQ